MYDSSTPPTSFRTQTKAFIPPISVEAAKKNEWKRILSNKAFLVTMVFVTEGCLSSFFVMSPLVLGSNQNLPLLFALLVGMLAALTVIAIMVYRIFGESSRILQTQIEDRNMGAFFKWLDKDHNILADSSGVNWDAFTEAFKNYIPTDGNQDLVFSDKTGVEFVLHNSGEGLFYLLEPYRDRK